MTKERKIFTEVNEKGEQVVLTKKQILEKLSKEKAIAENELYFDFIQYQIELLDRKSESRGSGKGNPENVKLAESLYDLLVKSGAETSISEILQTSEFAMTKGFSSPKIVALCKILENDGKIEKIKDKRKTYYKAIV